MIALLLFLQLSPADCQRDARCRIEMARLREAERARAAYLAAVEKFAEDLEQQQLDALPQRERHPIGADFQYTSIFPKWTGVVGYTPAWPVRLEFYGGRTTKYEYTGSGSVSNDETVSLTSFGLQARWFAAPWMFAPYLLTGLGWSFGSFDVDSFDTMSGQRAFTTLDASAHWFHTGVGLDFQWEWIHASIGYRFDWAYYTRAADPTSGSHVEPARKELSNVLDEWQHGVEFMIGARY